MISKGGRGKSYMKNYVEKQELDTTYVVLMSSIALSLRPRIPSFQKKSAIGGIGARKGRVMVKASITTPDLVVLSYLEQKPMHGYELNQVLESHDAKDWAGISRPQVYYSLNKLKKMRLIRRVSEGSDSLGPDKQVFEISEAGKKVLCESVSKQEWATQRPAPPFLTWLALSDHAPRFKARQIIEERRKFLRSEIEREKETLKSFPEEDSWPIKKAKLMIGLTIEHFESELKWLKNLEGEFIIV